MWQVGPSASTRTSRVSPSQSSRTSRTHNVLPEVSPLTHSRCRLRLQNVARPVVSVRCSASSFIQPTISTAVRRGVLHHGGDQAGGVAAQPGGHDGLEPAHTGAASLAPPSRDCATHEACSRE